MIGKWSAVRSGLFVVALAVITASCADSTQPRSQETSPTPHVATSLELQSFSEAIEALAAQVEALAAANASTPAPQAEDGSEIRSLSESINALADQVKALSDSNAELARQLSETPAQPSSPEEASPATSTSSGICGRTPEIQEAILMTLRLSSCRFVTDEELYRITNWRSLSGSSSNDINWTTPPQPGDFAGLVNLRRRIEVDGDFTLVEGAFQGLNGLKDLQVQVTGVNAGAFKGLPALESLEVSIRDVPEMPARVVLPVFDEMPSLKTLGIGIPSGTTLDLKANQFANLPNLETIGIDGHRDNEGSFILPSGLFEHNSVLKNVEIQLDYPSIIRIPVDIFANLHNLESLRIYGSDSDDLSLALSPRSPLFSNFLNRNDSPSGYTVVWPQAQ